MITTPEQQQAAAEAARKDSPLEEKKDEAAKPVPQPMAGSPSKLQTPTPATPKPA